MKSAPVESWDEPQRRVLEHREGPLLVLGGPGSGKTSLAAAAVAQALDEGDAPGRIWALVSSRRAASVMRNNIARRARQSVTAPPVMTMHGLCLVLMNTFSAAGEPVRLLTAPEQEARVRELLAGQPPGSWPDALAQARGTIDFARQVRVVLGRVRQFGLDPEDVCRFGRDAQRPEWEAVGRFLADYLDVLDAEGVLDYAELVHRTRILVETNQVQQWLRRRVDSIIVDDFAECDPAQIGMLRALLPATRSLVAFADPDQSINGFRGVHPRAVLDFPQLFAPKPDQRAPVVALLHNYRSGADLTRVTGRIASRLGIAGPVSQTAQYRAARPAGSVTRVEAWFCTGGSEQAIHVARLLREAHVLDGVAWQDMAVIVKSGQRDGVLVSRACADFGIPVVMDGTDIALGTEPAVRCLLAALDVVLRGGAWTQAEAEKLLTAPMCGLDSAGLRALSRWLRRHHLTLADLGDPALPLPPITGAGQDPHLEPVATIRAHQMLARLRSLVASAGRAAADDDCVSEVLWGIWQGTDWPDRLRRRALGGGADSVFADRSLDALCTLFDLAAQPEYGRGLAGLRQFVADVVEQQIPADHQRESRLSRRGVQVLTVHRAAGGQWPVVAVVGVQEGSWPDLRRRGSVFEPESLTTTGLTGPSEAGSLLAAERRLWYVACTRASQRLIVTAIDNGDEQPSRFLDDLGVIPLTAGDYDGHVSTLTDVVVSLRRASVAAEAAPALQQEAARRLAQLMQARDDEGVPLARDANPLRWWGVRQPSGSEPTSQASPIRLTASQVSSLLRCPRRYFLERKARAEPWRSPASAIGSIVHTLIQHAHELTDDQMIRILDDRWGQLSFPTTWEPQVKREAAVAALRRFRNWESRRTAHVVLGREVPFAVETRIGEQPVCLAGTIDRLDLDPQGRVWVVDYKTGTHRPTASQVDAHPQLGFYQLALDAGGLADWVPAQTPSGGAELVFLYIDPKGIGLPHTARQRPLREQRYLDLTADERDHVSWVHAMVSRAVAVLQAGDYPATPRDAGDLCRSCAFASSCPGVHNTIAVAR